jgi:hypothetical protein
MCPVKTTRFKPHTFKIAAMHAAVASSACTRNSGKSEPDASLHTSANVMSGLPVCSTRLCTSQRSAISVSRQPRLPQPHCRWLPAMGVCPISPVAGTVPS